jgi:hypothetical protein
MKMLMMLIGGIGAILLGLPYSFHAFGPTEAEVATWGRISIYMGAGLILLSVGTRHNSTRAAKALLSLGYSSLGLFQLLPILLWLAFHDSEISDGTPSSVFVAHWSYSIPHVALLVISLVILYQLWRLPTHLHAHRMSKHAK